jgi:hypothetical protein
MKKIILTAAAAIAAFAGVNAQNTASDASIYTVNVPQILSIATTPSNATFTHNLTEGQLTGGKTLQTVNWTVKSNGMWKAGASWTVTGTVASAGNSSLESGSIENFRNALKYSVDGTNWIAVPSNGGQYSPLPGFASAQPTSTSGASVNIQAKLEAMNFTVAPGTYTATSTITVTAL